MNHFEIMSFIRGENCELIGRGRWTFEEICDDLIRCFNLSVADSDGGPNYEWFLMVHKAYSELVREQEIEDQCRYFGWVRQASAA